MKGQVNEATCPLSQRNLKIFKVVW